MDDELPEEPVGEETLIPAFDRHRLRWRRIISAAGDKRGNKTNFSSSHQRSTNRAKNKRSFRACEICNANGVIRCGRCQTTYYCTIEHQEFDFLPLHSVVCEELGRIRGDEQMIASLSKEALHNLSERKEELARKCIALGRNYLAVGTYESAIPTGLLTIKLLRDIFGSFAEELLEPYLTLTLAALGMADIRIAKEFFALARLVYQNKNDPVTDIYVRSRFLRVWSRVVMFDGKQMDSCYMAAKDIYHWTMQLGLHHIKTAFGYFSIGINYWILDDKRRAKENILQAVLIAKQTLYDVIVRIMDVYDAASSFDKQPIYEAMRERGYEHIDGDERDELMLILHTAVCIYGRQAHKHSDVFPAVYYAISYLNIINMQIHRGLLYFARAAQSAAGAPNEEIIELFNHIDIVYEQIKRRDKTLIDGTDSDEKFEIGQEYEDDAFIPMRNSLWQIIKHFDDIEETRRRERDAELEEAYKNAAGEAKEEPVVHENDDEFAKLLQIESAGNAKSQSNVKVADVTAAEPQLQTLRVAVAATPSATANTMLAQPPTTSSSQINTETPEALPAYESAATSSDAEKQRPINSEDIMNSSSPEPIKTSPEPLTVEEVQQVLSGATTAEDQSDDHHQQPQNSSASDDVNESGVSSTSPVSKQESSQVRTKDDDDQNLNPADDENLDDTSADQEKPPDDA